MTNVSDFVGQKITVNGYGYRDVVNLGIDGTTGAIGTASQISGTVQVRNFGGGPGLTTLNVDDSADTAVRDVQIRDASIVGLGPAVITYDPKDLLALNIVGTRGFIPGAFVGRLASPLRGNTYDVLSTPGVNNAGALVRTTLTVLGAGGDAVSVLATSNTSLADKGVQGTLQIVSPNHLTALSIYGYIAPLLLVTPGVFSSGSIFQATTSVAPKVSQAALNKSVKLFASLLADNTKAQKASRASLKVQKAALKIKKAARPVLKVKKVARVALKVHRVSKAAIKVHVAVKSGLAANLANLSPSLIGAIISSIGSVSNVGKIALPPSLQGAINGINGNSGKGSSSGTAAAFPLPSSSTPIMSAA